MKYFKYRSIVSVSEIAAVADTPAHDIARRVHTDMQALLDKLRQPSSVQRFLRLIYDEVFLGNIYSAQIRFDKWKGR
jgi:hypothetical protein